MLGYILLVVILTKIAKKNTKYSKKQNSTCVPFLGSLYYISSSLFPEQWHCDGLSTTVMLEVLIVVGSYYRPRPLRCVHPWLKGGARAQRAPPVVSCGKWPTRMAMEQTQTYHMYLYYYRIYIIYIYTVFFSISFNCDLSTVLLCFA